MKGGAMEPNISIQSLLKKDGQSILECVSKAESKAIDFIAKSTFIRDKHQKGRKNKSFESTLTGALQTTESITEHLQKETPTTVTFFGEHIREAIRTIRAALHK